MVKGDDCPSGRGSLVVKFNVWLNKTRRVPISKWLIPIRNKENIKTNHNRKIAHGTQLFSFLPVENPPFVHLFFSTQIFKFDCTRVTRTKSPHRASIRAGHVLMGLPLLYGSPPRREESKPSPGGRLPTLRFSSCGQEHSFHYHQVHLVCPQAVRCGMLGFRFGATSLGTSRRGTLYMCIHVHFCSLTPTHVFTMPTVVLRSCCLCLSLGLSVHFSLCYCLVNILTLHRPRPLSPPLRLCA